LPESWPKETSNKLSFRYDREADILHIDKCPPYAAQESEELGDEVIARINPSTTEVELSKCFSSPHGCCAMNSSSFQWQPTCGLPGASPAGDSHAVGWPRTINQGEMG
jgi:hypothetical protein